MRLIQYVFGFVSVTLNDVAHYSRDRIESNVLTRNTYVSVESLMQDRMGKKNSERMPTDISCSQFNHNDVLIGNIRPYLKKIWFADCNGGTNGDVLVIRSSDNEILYPRYLYHILSSDKFFAYDNNNAKGAKMPRGDKAKIMQYKFELPPIEEQRKVVNILDRFDKLCNDNSIGLLAEIEKRNVQYAHYRDKLLTF